MRLVSNYGTGTKATGEDDDDRRRRRRQESRNAPNSNKKQKEQKICVNVTNCFSDIDCSVAPRRCSCIVLFHHPPVPGSPVLSGSGRVGENAAAATAFCVAAFLFFVFCVPPSSLPPVCLVIQMPYSQHLLDGCCMSCRLVTILPYGS